jgi:DNA-binding NarL/FixJ family response regulator
VTQLTPRQRDVVELVAQGLTYGVIGRRLGISPATVRVHVAAVAETNGARNTPPLRWVLANASRLLAA